MRRKKNDDVAEPAHGNFASGTKIALQINESPDGSQERRFQYQACTTYKSMNIQPGDSNVDPNTKLVLQSNENTAGSQERRFEY